MVTWKSCWRLQPSTGENEQDSKKPRRSQRISSQTQTTPLDKKSHLPSPLTHQESTVTEEYKEATVSPPEGRPSQIRHRTPQSISSPPKPGLTSPPGDTQAFSQFIHPPTLSHEVEDEEAEGVWGYLVPIDSVFGETLVLRSRNQCPAPYPSGDFGKGSKKRAKGLIRGLDYAKQEVQYEVNKRTRGFPAGGYLIGRHPECGRTLPQNAIRYGHRLTVLRSGSRAADYFESPLSHIQRKQRRAGHSSCRGSLKQWHLCQWSHYRKKQTQRTRKYRWNLDPRPSPIHFLLSTKPRQQCLPTTV